MIEIDREPMRTWRATYLRNAIALGRRAKTSKQKDRAIFELINEGVLLLLELQGPDIANEVMNDIQSLDIEEERVSHFRAKEKTSGN